MRKLEKQEINDLLYGCAVVGTGGGDLALGLAAIEEDFRQGKELFLAKPEEVPAGSYVSVPYMCGSPARLDKCGKEYARLPVLGYPESLLAFRTLDWEEPILLMRFTLPVSWDFRSLTGIRRDVPYRNCSTALFGFHFDYVPFS